MRITLPHEARANLDRHAAASGHSHTRLSRLIDRSPGYIGRHIREGVPTLLADADARLLADFLGISCGELGVIDRSDVGCGRRVATKPRQRAA